MLRSAGGAARCSRFSEPVVLPISGQPLAQLAPRSCRARYASPYLVSRLRRSLHNLTLPHPYALLRGGLTFGHPGLWPCSSRFRLGQSVPKLDCWLTSEKVFTRAFTPLFHDLKRT